MWPADQHQRRAYIRWLTANTIAFRTHLEELRMPLELKGLKANLLKLQARVDRLNSLASAGDEKGAVLESHLSDIGKQLGAHIDDIEFAANVLGNSSGASQAVAEKPAEQGAPEQPRTPPANPAPVPGLPEGTATRVADLVQPR